MGNFDHYAYGNFELFSSKVVKWSRHNLALVVLRIFVWAKHLTSALCMEFQLVQGVIKAGEAACQDSLYL